MHYKHLLCIFVLSTYRPTASDNRTTPQVPDLPSWPVDCNFTVYEGKGAFTDHYGPSIRTPSRSACQSLCAEDSKCGMYVRGWNTQNCYKVQHSRLIWERAGISVDDLMRHGLDADTGSRQCEEQTVNEECNEYREYKNWTYPASGYITNIWPSSLSLTATQCQNLCTVYSKCRSVLYNKEATRARCHLYNTTISDVGEVECGSARTECGTYERYCPGGQPYDPHTYSPPTTTSDPTGCPTDLSLYHGATACLPVGHPRKLCDSMPGCCYIQVLSTGLCLRPDRRTCDLGGCGSCFNDTDCNAASEYCDNGPLVMRDQNGHVSGTIPLASLVLPTLTCTARKENGRECENDEQCQSTRCDLATGLCGRTLLANGKRCSSGSECESGVCRTSVSPPACGLLQADETCTTDGECATGKCTNGKCGDPSPVSSKLADGEICTSSLQCASVICSLQVGLSYEWIRTIVTSARIEKIIFI